MEWHSAIRDRARGGYIALLSVLVVAAIAAATILVLFVTSLNTAINSGNISDAKTARALSDACAERALQSLTSNSPLPPREITNFSGGTCTITSIINTSGNIWQIHATGATISPVGSIEKYIEIQAVKPGTASAAIVTSWKECLQFPCP